MSSSVKIFEYPSSDSPPPALWEVMTEIGAGLDRANGNKNSSAFGEPLSADSERSTAISAEETKRIFEAGRAEGIREAHAQWADRQKALLREEENKRAEQAVHLAGRLAAERDLFLKNVEHEVVKLALAIAARVLRREAQVDPLFLIGAVRVVLGQLAEAIQVKLRVPADETELWSETIAHLPNLRNTPSVISDDRLQLGECVIETEMGSVDLGVSTQLREAERSLFHPSGSSALDGKVSGFNKNSEERV